MCHSYFFAFFYFSTNFFHLLSVAVKIDVRDMFSLSKNTNYLSQFSDLNSTSLLVNLRGLADFVYDLSLKFHCIVMRCCLPGNTYNRI